MATLHTNKFYPGDCVDVMDKFPESSVDLIVFSPPYGKKRQYNGFPPFNPKAVGEQCFRVLKDGGVVAVNIQNTLIGINMTSTKEEMVLQWKQIGFNYHQEIIWERHGTPGQKKYRFRCDHESVYVFVKGKHPKFVNLDHKQMHCKYYNKEMHGFDRKGDGGKNKRKPNLIPKNKDRGTVWKIVSSSHEHNKSKTGHPATFPDELASDIIQHYSRPGDIVLDPFVGSGTTAAMAWTFKRKFIGIDVCEKYIVTMARPRLNDMGCMNCFLTLEKLFRILEIKYQLGYRQTASAYRPPVLANEGARTVFGRIEGNDELSIRTC